MKKYNWPTHIKKNYFKSLYFGIYLWTLRNLCWINWISLSMQRIKRNSCYARYTLQQTICVIGRKTTHGYHWRIGERSDDWVYHRTTYLCHPSPFQFKQYVASYFTALEDSVVLMATKDSTFKVISQDPQVLHNFLCIAGNCNICTVSRLKPLSRKTVRERFIVYLFEHKKKILWL